MQSAIASSLTAGRQGMLACATDEALIQPAIASDAIRCGLLAQLAAPTDSPNSMLAKLVASIDVDVDAILATGASSAAQQTITGASLDGVSGNGALLTPARRITLVLSSHANWDLTTAYISGIDAFNRPLREALIIPDAGAATLTTKGYFSRVTEVIIPAQAGTSGTFTVGIAADDAMFTARDSGVVIYNPAHEPYASGEAFTAADPVGILKRGRIWVPVEAAVAVNAQAYVRCATASTDIRGQWTGAPTSSFAPYPNACFRTSTSGAGLAVLELF